MLEQLTTEELKAELEARLKKEAMAESRIFETGYAQWGESFYALKKCGQSMVSLHEDGTVIIDVEVKSIGKYHTPCTREDFMAALENNFTKIREALA
jgi:hypothetical protein